MYKLHDIVILILGVGKILFLCSDFIFQRKAILKINCQEPRIYLSLWHLTLDAGGAPMLPVRTSKAAWRQVPPTA
jgi:hypothetical protein